ncbi:sulfur carrier protein ThiS [Crocinitomicaceae bacterium]|jgi:sulfur carrier protein|nr:sulfur carrier protein ThiS [Crocinitomicaceae bacterium]MDC1186259.1 sulfur carrier protein ThiS [Crocinitomicaceae bacterium]MDG2464393.1 sulfur carrier protein ThiS [Crocinitomicaceae bacterium]
MEVKFNGELMSIQSVYLSELLEERALNGKTGIAVAVNSTVVSKSKWSKTMLQENDEILIITAAAGG